MDQTLAFIGVGAVGERPVHHPLARHDVFDRVLAPCDSFAAEA